MAAGDKSFVKYHWFSADLVTSLPVQHKKKNNLSLWNNSNTLHDHCLSVVGHSSNAFSRSHFASASKNIFCLISRSVREYISGSLGLHINAEKNSYADNCSGCLFNIIGIDRWQDKLWLPNPGQSACRKLLTVNSESCCSDLKTSHSFFCSGPSEFHVHNSIEQIPFFDLCSKDNARTSILSSIQKIPSIFFLETCKGEAYGGREKCPGGFARGFACDIRPSDCLSDLCQLGKLFKGQSCTRFDFTGEVQWLRSVLNLTGNSEIISDNFKGNAVNCILNPNRPNALIASLASTPLNIVTDKYCKEHSVSMNDFGGHSDKDRIVHVLASSSLQTETKLQQCLKHLQLTNVSLRNSQDILDSSKLLQRYTLHASSLGKDSGKGKLEDKLIQQISDLVSNEVSLRRDTHTHKANSDGLFTKTRSNALAGALAGTFVSLWLHPIDTVKTVIQSRTVGHRSVFHNLGSIMSERGMAGLYRGIGSNLASSAPISGIYTFTYESVKAALLPHLAKEYHSFAHCVAGGCASIATSFIYTPTDCIKQQMQVGSQYRNSWNALNSILEKGGFPLLYAGWGAVLCRNVPQSVIKFCTYEGLKHLALHNHPAEKQLSTLQSLAFGGLAGSTAALFTTPFDVIKTRLQTQIPGSPTYYEGVFQAFEHIAKQEGLGGLYRGLLPRLVIYISQGALFFASYEFFKQVLSIEVRRIAIQTSQSRGANNMNQSTIVEST